MTSNLEANLKVGISRNPNNCPPSSAFIFHPDILLSCVNKIQRIVRNRDIRCSVEQSKEAMKNQAHRVDLISYVPNFITTGTYHKPLLGSEDPTIMKTFSSFDKQHVTLKAHHIAGALQILVNSWNNESAVTWIKCCETATEVNYKVVKRARTVAG